MLIGSHAVFQEGLALLAQPIPEYSLGLSVILGQDMGEGW